MTAQPLSAPRRLLAVLCGGFLGTLIRYGLSTIIQACLGTGWPYDILLINLTGACALALLTTLADAALLIGPTRRLLLTTGLLGAYTTFSSLALGDILLFNKGAWLLALLYLILSLFGGMFMILLGDRLGQILIARLDLRLKLKTSQDLQPTHELLQTPDGLRLPEQVETPHRHIP